MGQPDRGNKTLAGLFLLFLLLFQGIAFCQLSPRPLVEILQKLEKRYSVRFVYLDEDVDGIVLGLRPRLGLDESLEQIERATSLIFEELEPGYFTIQSRPKGSICGQVLDNYARSRMGGATVEVLPDGKKIAADEEGYFRLDSIPETATLKIRFLGFQPRFVSATEFKDLQGECMKILLAQDVQRLREVILFPLLTSGIEPTRDGATRIRPDDFGLLPGLTEADVLQVLQSLPGVESNQERVSDLNIRGGTNAENLILWNGIKMYQAGHFFGLISAFQPQLANEVVAYKNGTPARFGDGVSGLVMMNSSQDRPEEHSGGGGFNMISADAYGRNPIGRNMGLEWSIRRSHTDLWESPVYQQYRKRVFQDSDLEQIRRIEEDFYFGDFSARFYWDISDDHRLRLSALGIQNRLQSSNAQFDQESRLNQQNLSLGAELLSQWTPQLSTNLLLYQTNYELESNTDDRLNNQTLFQNNDVLERKLAVQLVYEISNQSRILAGYDFIETGIANLTDVSQPPFSSRIKGVVFSEGVHGEWHFSSPSPRFTGRIGLRLSAYENVDTFSKVLVEPRVSARFQLTKDLHLQVMGESKSQVTQQILDLEQNFLGIEKRRWILSDDQALPVVSSEQLSAGLEYSRDKWYGTLSLFSKEVTDISTRTQGFQNFNQFSGEIGGYQVQGVETLVNFRDRMHSHWIGYAFNQNTYEFPDLEPPNFPGQQDVRHALSWGSTIRWNRWYFGLGGKWRSGRPFTPATGLVDGAVPSRIDYAETNSARLPSYFRFDGSVSYKFPIGRRILASVSASVWNLTNRVNTLDRYYQIDEEGELQEINNTSLGITPDFSFRIKF